MIEGGVIGVVKAVSITLSARVEGLHVKDVDALHLSEDFETLETGSLVDIGGDGTGLSTGTEEVGLGRDLCHSRQIVSFPIDAAIDVLRGDDAPSKGLTLLEVWPGLGSLCESTVCGHEYASALELDARQRLTASNG